MTSIKTGFLTVTALALASSAIAAAAGAGAVATQKADVRGEDSGRLVVAKAGATLQRSDSGLPAKLQMQTLPRAEYVAPGSYLQALSSRSWVTPGPPAP